MSWLYSQRSGEVKSPSGDHFLFGYAGNGPGLNNPDAQDVQNVGPLPRGKYRMSNFVQAHPTVGSCAIELSPYSTNQMFGRSGFFIHGLAIMDPLHSSHGCPIIGNNNHRIEMWQHADHCFEVTE